MSKSTPNKAEGKSRFRRVNDWLHLWLGLISGIIVFVVCITGCIWVFNEEITGMLHPERHVAKQELPVLIPSEIQRIAQESHPGQRVQYAYYLQGKSVEVGVGKWEAPERFTLRLHPYTGEVLSSEKQAKGETDFFSFILHGHRALWLPYEVGRPIVNYATLVFVVLLITGLIWWFPKKWNKSSRKKSFTIKWRASFKRVNIDLHNVLGFYAMLFLLVIALTGMVWGLAWWSDGLYWVTSGGEAIPEWKEHQSDTLQADKLYTSKQAMDLAWSKVIKDNPRSEGFYYGFPDTTNAKSAISITIYPGASQFYNSTSVTFDRHTLRELEGHAVYDKPFAQSSFAGKLRKMNYDIHIGSILGFPGKVLAFLAALTGASLPITGFLIWWGRKFKRKKELTTKHKTNGKHAARPKVQIKPHVRITNQKEHIHHEI